VDHRAGILFRRQRGRAHPPENAELETQGPGGDGVHEHGEEEPHEEDLCAGDTDGEWTDTDLPDAPPTMPASLPASSSAGPAVPPGWQKMRLQERIRALRLIHGRGPR
jgi:hypothetical protein